MLNKKPVIILVCAATIAVVIFANLRSCSGAQSSAATNPGGFSNGTTSAAPSTLAAAGPGQVSPEVVQGGLRAVVTAVRPAVVSISVSQDLERLAPRTGMQLLDPFAARSTLVGSGVIVAPAGYILSSLQVTRNADVVKVTLFRGGTNTFLARVVAVDPGTDLVLLRLPFGGDLPYAAFGDSSRVRTGDIVVAMGSPFGLFETVTQGIVSTSKRTVVVEGQRIIDMIQTDAAINQGNSGGPLINISSEVIGINTVIYSTDSSFSGIGFAIPSNQARSFVQRTLAGRGL